MPNKRNVERMVVSLTEQAQQDLNELAKLMDRDKTAVIRVALRLLRTAHDKEVLIDDARVVIL